MKLNLFFENSINYWNSKPLWCQPWSIMLTGVLIIAFAYFKIPFVWIKLLVFLLICFWWYLFLILAPSINPDMKDIE